ncbi:hypothetical protein, partial [Escherichia coli]|uniref:hypothetical protein n=1 Tax=Escherichia coli TaxID=562 RepID=UPI001BC87FB4
MRQTHSFSGLKWILDPERFLPSTIRIRDTPLNIRASPLTHITTSDVVTTTDATVTSGYLIFVDVFIHIPGYGYERFLIVVILLCFRMRPGQYNLLNRSV